MRIVKATVPFIYYTAINMRQRDYESILRQTWLEDDRQIVAEHFVRTYAGDGISRIFTDDANDPITFFWMAESRPGVWTSVMFSTESWDAIAVDATKHIRRNIKGVLMGTDGHRFEMHETFDPVVDKWLVKMFGLTREGILRSAGRDGMDLAIYASTREDVERERIGQCVSKALVTAGPQRQDEEKKSVSSA